MEKDIEAMLRRRVEAMGGRFLKFVSPNNRGVPDRIAIFPGGAIWFVELKDDGGKMGKLQEWWQKELTRLGCRAVCLTGMDQAIAWIKERGGGAK